MINRIIAGGRLTRDPELRQVGDSNVANFTLACDRDFKNREGERETDFIDCVAWGGTAEFAANYFSKGRMAIVDGRLQIRDYTDKDGNNRRKAEIRVDNMYFGDSKPSDASENQQVAPTARVNTASIPAEDDGELPF